MTKQPNFLLICSDQHNVRTVGAYGNPVIATPHLDQLCSKGVRFEAAYCNSPICGPSRMSFLSGKFPFHCDAFHNGCVLDSRLPTLATLLAGAGYHTALAGRMHLNGPDQHHGFVERVFGDVMPYAFHGLGRGLPHAPLEGDLGHCEKPDPLRVVGSGMTSFIPSDRTVTAATCAWLESYAASSSRRPFLMMAGLFNPHCPYIAPADLYQKYAGRVTVPPVTAEQVEAMPAVHRDYLKRIDILNIPPENLNKAAAAYYGLVELVDQQVGAMLAVLERTGLLDNTIVIYFSDHGEMMGEHGRWHKQCFYEASARVPLVIRHPDFTSSAGRTAATPVTLVDLLPTLVEWGGARLDYAVDGASLTPDMQSGTPAAARPALTEYYDWPFGNRMARDGDWKLNYHGQDEYCELFDLKNDPGEMSNLAADPKAAERLTALQRLVFSGGWNRNVRTEFDTRLNASGSWSAVHHFSRALADDPFLREIPGYWREIESCDNWLDD